MIEEIIGRLSDLTGAQLGSLEDELRRERLRRASSADGGQDTSHVQEGSAPPLTEVLEYRPHEDGYLQLELRRYIRRDGSLTSVDPARTSSSTRVASVRELLPWQDQRPREHPLAAQAVKALGGLGRSPGLPVHERTRSTS